MLVCGKVLLIGATVFLLLRFVVAVRICRSTDMYPTIKDGDLVVVQRTHDVTFDDVVLYVADGKEHLGRVVSVAGERVAIENDSGLWVEDSLVYNTLPYPTTVKDESVYPLTVGEGEVFVLGDLRNQCEDSRDFGPIAKNQVIGKQIYLMRWRGF